MKKCSLPNKEFGVCLTCLLFMSEFQLLIIGTLTLIAMKDLTAQVSSEDDPVSFLPKVVALLFLQVCFVMSFILFISQIFILYAYFVLSCIMF